MPPSASSQTASAPAQPAEALGVGEPSQIWLNDRFVSFRAYQQSTAPVYPALGTDTQQINLSGVNNSERARTVHPITRSPAEKSWTLPGTTVKADESCGTVLRWVACSRDPTHWKRPIVEHCDRVECPVCWTFWAKKQAKRLADKLRGYVADVWEHLEGFEWHKENAQNIRHWAFSPPENLITPEMSYDKIKEIGKRFVLESGVTGGVLVFHPWRIREELTLRLILSQKIVRLSNEEKEKKFWQCARDDVLGLGDWRDYCYWSPHYHVIGFGYVENARELHNRTGWVYKHIRDIPVLKIRTPEGVDDAIAQVCFYILSHAAYQWLKKIPVWFGCCTPRNLKKKGEPIPSEFDGMKILCPKCTARLVEYQDIDGKVGEKKLTEEGEEIYHTIHDVVQKYEITEEGLCQNWRKKQGLKVKFRADHRTTSQKGGT